MGRDRLAAIEQLPTDFPDRQMFYFHQFANRLKKTVMILFLNYSQVLINT